MEETAEPIAHPKVHDASCVLNSLNSQEQPCLPTRTEAEGGDKPLESHEVVELQTFSERKAWIETKIKFLESLPPVDIFHGLKYLHASAPEVPGLPTREELQAMVVEHDAIEKETEVFDNGELKKLRQLTKAATQRNLSPADTDLIELTLTTIYELDKLLHLLRDRSDNLEMMSIRLTWEENRQAAWRERRQVIEGLRNFVETRARWKSSIYDHSSKNQEPSDSYPRRGSVASLASTGSSDSVNNSPTFSRSARFKLAELLSRDAAQYTGRVTGLKHGMVSAAGKALDKLIDHSRKPVPDELLDEQDKVEEMCINDLENIGKFTLGLVMQWRKADEIYVETMKDQLLTANLFEEIETAQMYHPTARQSATFISRIDTILKRLAVRGNPASPANLFPRPEHPLFPDQREANTSLVQKLSNDLSAANRLARKVDDAAKDYRSRYEAVKRVEDLTQSMNDVVGCLTFVNKKFQEGTFGDDGDGSPPDLTTEDSLEPTHHNVFLALLPSLLEEASTGVQRADKLLRSAPSAVLGLDLPGIDQEFKETASVSVRKLSSHRDEAIRLRDSVVQRVARLRESRKIASNIDSKFSLLKSARIEIARSMDQHRWHQESGDASAPLTPESPLVDLTSSPIPLPFEDQLTRVSSSLELDVGQPLDKLFVSLEPELHFVLKQRYSNLHATVDASYQMLRLLGSIKEQTSAMISVRDNFHKLSVQVEDARIRCASHIDVLLGSHSDNDSTSEFNVENMDFIEKEVTLFLEGLTDQVPFVARHSRSSKRPSLFPLMSPTLNDSDGLVDIWSEISFDLASVDAAVRADSNYYAMRISGNLEALLQTKTHLNLAQLARQLDNGLSSTLQDINGLSQQFSTQKDFFNAVKRHCPETIGHLHAILNEFDIFRAKRNNIARSLSPIRELLRQMEETSRPFSPTIRNLYDSRIHATDDAELRLHSWDERMETLKHEIRLALDDEQRYQEGLRAAEVQRILEDERRQADEEAERLRREQERQKEEERLRLLEVKRVEEELQEQERRRISEELIERERLQREAVEAELLRREEEERQAEVARIKSEQERIAKDEVDKALREQERQEIVEKLRLAEEILETERKMHTKNERIARDLAEKQDMEMGKLTRRQAEMERLALEAQERREREESERQDMLRLEQEAKEKLARTKKKGKAREARLPTIPQDPEDVFMVQNTTAGSPMPLPRNIVELQAQVIRLRKHLRSIEISQAVHPTESSADLPTEEQYEFMSNELASVLDATQKLPPQVEDASTDRELQSLSTEVQRSSRLLNSVEKLVQMQKAVHVCDGALSDLLEHIDSYPAPPLGTSSLHKSQPGVPPEEQLSARLGFTKQTVDDATTTLGDVIEDSRAISEHNRIQQTWSELNEMAGDRMVGKKSRSPSVISGQSSGRNSSASSQPFQTHARNRKAGSYSNLSVSSINLPSRPKMLAPPQHTARRTLSSSRDTPTRSTSRLSTTSTVSRAVSGPVRNMLHETTFASRQRTTSLTCSNPVPLRPPTSLRTERGRTRPSSPTTSDHLRSQSRSFNRTARAPSRTSSNSSTWSRAPRNSLSSIMQRNITPKKKPVQPLTRKQYIADPKSKLDVAVGDVVNKLPVGINVEGVTETWHDQSGKYWIGNDEPKLCFCRILRSQTVMVRVGGGWAELSKFIKNHFADNFRILPDSPPRTGVREAKWISSATLLEAQGSPPVAPKTPEPTFPFLPTFALMTPSARSPHSLKSSPSAKGSPLTPLQFIRKADSDLSLLRPVTPSKSPHRSRMPSNPNTPVWRP